MRDAGLVILEFFHRLLIPRVGDQFHTWLTIHPEESEVVDGLVIDREAGGVIVGGIIRGCLETAECGYRLIVFDGSDDTRPPWCFEIDDAEVSYIGQPHRLSSYQRHSLEVGIELIELRHVANCSKPLYMKIARLQQEMKPQLQIEMQPFRFELSPICN